MNAKTISFRHVAKKIRKISPSPFTTLNEYLESFRAAPSRLAAQFRRPLVQMTAAQTRFPFRAR